MTRQGIPTLYQGIRFRSREQWAQRLRELGERLPDGLDAMLFPEAAE